MQKDDVLTLSTEDRLEALAYQFLTLYERWAEDRQAAAKQGVETTKLVQLFTEQVKGFKELEPHVRQQIVASIQNTTTNAVKTISEEMGKEATRAVEHTARQLTHHVEQAQRTLGAYQQEVITTQWKVILTTALTTMVTCFLLVWLLIPKPTLPLTDTQVTYLNGGKIMSLVWPKLSKAEQQHWQQLAEQVEHPEQ